MNTIRQLDFQVPVRTVSELNVREHWAIRMKRKQSQQEEILVAWQNNTQGRKVQLPCVVKLTRIGPRTLDGDNCQSSLKFCRDQIARQLGVDDGSDQVRWEYSQIKNGSKEYGLRISVTSQE